MCQTSRRACERSALICRDRHRQDRRSATAKTSGTPSGADCGLSPRIWVLDILALGTGRLILGHAAQSHAIGAQDPNDDLQRRRCGTSFVAVQRCARSGRPAGCLRSCEVRRPPEQSARGPSLRSPVVWARPSRVAAWPTKRCPCPAQATVGQTRDLGEYRYPFPLSPGLLAERQLLHLALHIVTHG